MGSARYLIDKSAWWRGNQPAVRSVLDPMIGAGRVGVCLATELEIGFSARSIRDYEDLRGALDRLLPILMPARAERRAREVQAELVARGQHRAVGVPDLMIAATAELEGLTVLHYDADFDLIAEITAQATEWVVEQGSID